MLRVPQRYISVLLLDLNSGLTPHHADDPVVEAHGPHRRACGKLVHEWLTVAKMMAVNTSWGVGDIYYGMKCASSQIDYICIPQSARGLVKWTAAWRRTVEKTRAMAAALDHVPVVTKLQIVAAVSQQPLRER
eukprot:9484723-Pyramimonas_sp.AAC.1